jgi:hypothetical protein
MDGSRREESLSPLSGCAPRSALRTRPCFGMPAIVASRGSRRRAPAAVDHSSLGACSLPIRGRQEHQQLALAAQSRNSVLISPTPIRRPGCDHVAQGRRSEGVDGRTYGRPGQLRRTDGARWRWKKSFVTGTGDCCPPPIRRWADVNDETTNLRNSTEVRGVDGHPTERG